MLRPSSFVLVSAAASLLLGCPHPPECSEAEACSPGFVCQEGTCVPENAGGGGGACSDPAGPNVLNNPGFECGLEGWEANVVRPGDLTHETATVRTGKGAARLTVTGGTPEMLYLGSVKDPAPGSTWCAWAWMRGTTPDGRLTVTRVQDGTIVEESFSTPVNDAEWSRAPASFPLKLTVGANDTELLLNIRAQTPNAGDYLLVDDIALWESKDGTCSERS